MMYIHMDKKRQQQQQQRQQHSLFYFQAFITLPFIVK